MMIESIPFYLYIILFNILLGFFHFTKWKNLSHVLYLFIFLIITLIVEFIGSILSYNGKNSVSLYNAFTLFEFLFYFLLIKKIIQKKTAKKIIDYSSLIYAMFYLINFFFIQGKNSFQSYSYAIGSLGIVGFCIYFFYELFQIPKNIYLLKQDSFWIISALLFYYTISFPVFGVTNVVSTLPNIIIDNLRTFISILNVLLYSMFSIAFICRLKTKKSSSSSLSGAS